jgi:tRNA uridine 5-carboxymethylaminomethyl modification enzyme
LLLREDNADRRLTPTGRRLGLVDDARFRVYIAKHEAIEAERGRLDRIVLQPGAAPPGSAFAPLHKETRAGTLLRRPEGRYSDIVALDVVGASTEIERLMDAEPEQAEQIALSLETDARYAGYIERQSRDIERSRRQTELRLPLALNYADVTGLSNEVREKLGHIRPETIGQATRIPGMTPAAISLLLVHIKKASARPRAQAQDHAASTRRDSRAS